MPRNQVIATVNGYLHDWGVAFERSEDGETFRLIHGSTAAYIDFYEMGTSTVVHVHAPVLIGVDEDAPIDALAVLNGELPFGKLCFYPDQRVVALEYELLGDFLDQEELVNAIMAVATLADDWDDRLLRDFGGQRHVAENAAAPGEQDV